MINSDDVIKQQLLLAMDRFLKHLPADVQDTIIKNGYIAGGAVVSLVLDEKINDYDLFFKTEGAVAVIKTFFDTPKQLGNISIKAVTVNGITIVLEETGEVFQLVTRFYGDTNRVFTTFDFTHCRAFFDLNSHDLMYHKDVIEAKKLVYDGIDQYPVNALKRMVRFVKRGWEPDNETILNICDKLSSLDLKDEKVRSNQLIGFYGTRMDK